MTITKTTNLEEVVFAFQGDVDGSYKAGHAVYFTVIKDGDQEISHQRGKATTISELAASGFTWPEVCAAINIGTMTQCEAQAATIAERDEQLVEATQAKTAAEAARDTALAQVAELQAQLAARASAAAMVPMAEARIILSRAGKLEAIESAIAAMQGQPGVEARILWATSPTISPADPMVAALGPKIGSPEEVIALFAAAHDLAQQRAAAASPGA